MLKFEECWLCLGGPIVFYDGRAGGIAKLLALDVIPGTCV